MKAETARPEDGQNSYQSFTGNFGLFLDNFRIDHLPQSLHDSPQTLSGRRCSMSIKYSNKGGKCRIACRNLIYFRSNTLE